MLGIERRNRIIEKLRLEKIVTVEHMADHFDVSVMTIRRDLERLEKEGHVVRCHGGAVLRQNLSQNAGFQKKHVSNLDEKKLMACYAKRYVSAGSIIYLDTGTTILQLAKEIIAIPDLTVVTNDITIAGLMSESEATVLMLGGTLLNGVGSTHGPMTDAMMADLMVETAFVSGQAVNHDYDLFYNTETKMNFRRLLMRQANRVHLLVDSSKFNRQSLFRVHNISEYSSVISDKKILDGEQKTMEKNKINFISLSGWDGEPR